MIVIERFCDHPDLGCLSEIIIHGTRFCYGIEQPYNDNKPFKSSIPAGEYELVSYDSPTYGESLAFYNPALNVMVDRQDADTGDRFACLIHAANWAHQLQGCLAPGSAITWGTDKKKDISSIMLTSSKSTLGRLREQMKAGDKVLIRYKHGE